MDLTRQLLDELMGKDRNLSLVEKNKKQEHYNDPDICKYFLVSFCPHDLFPNTKSDLGKCTRRHDEKFQLMFQNDPNRTQYEKRYIQETISIIENLLSGVDSKIKKGMNRLETNVYEVETPKEVTDKLEAIDQEIKRLLGDVEKLGEEGQLEESEAVANEVENLKKSKEEIKASGDSTLNPGSKQMKVCDVCGALQTINDTDKRTQTHLEGKLHTGFAILRRELETLRKRREELRNMQNNNYNNNNNYRNRDREKEKEKEKVLEKEKEKEKEPSKIEEPEKTERKKRSRSRSGSRHKSRKHRDGRKRSHSRSKDRKHKSKKDKRDKSRSRSSSKEKKKKQDK